MSQPRRHPGELHEVVEIGDGGIAPAVVQIGDERRPVYGREHDVVAADFDAPSVAAPQSELTRRGRAELMSQTGLEAHPHAVDPRPSRPEQLQRLVISAELDADLVEDPIGMGFQTG